MEPRAPREADAWGDPKRLRRAPLEESERAVVGSTDGAPSGVPTTTTGGTLATAIGEVGAAATGAGAAAAAGRATTAAGTGGLLGAT